MPLPGWIKAVFMADYGIEQMCSGDSGAAPICPISQRSDGDLPARKKNAHFAVTHPVHPGLEWDRKGQKQLWLFATLHLCWSLNRNTLMGVTLPPNCTGVLQQMAWPKVVLFNSPGSARSNSRSPPWQPRSSYSSCINHGVLLLCKHVSPNLRDAWLLDSLQVGFFSCIEMLLFFSGN